MIRINPVKFRPEAIYDKNKNLKNNIIKLECAKLLKIPAEKISDIKIVRRSIDARKKPDLFYVLAVDVTLTGINEDECLKRCKSDKVTKSVDSVYTFPSSGEHKLSERPIIVGMGPAGLFCAYELALHGYKPIVLERGSSVEERTKDIEQFWKNGILKTDSNVQFGEGGAGTFSDGKLNTLVKDKNGRNHEVLRIFHQFGGSEEILYDSKPHLGTDQLVTIVKNIREAIISLGGEIHFHSKMVDFVIQKDRITQVITEDGSVYPCGVLVLAIGHSARDTFEMLHHKHIPMEAKAFAVGLRVEHLKEQINLSQYGHTDADILGAAPYKLTAKSSDGRGVYSFCMCPGGYVVNASSEIGRLAVNGMSYSGRDSKNANSAIIITVTPKDYKSSHPLAGIEFQRELEENAYRIGQGDVPVSYYDVFKAELEQELQSSIQGKQFADLIKEQTDSGDKKREITPCIKGNYRFSSVSQILPTELSKAFVEGMEHFDQIIPGFAGSDVLVEGIESRTSSPVRIHRDEQLKGCYTNFYPCGEGAGYAGGITSAAMDGMRVAEMIALEYTSIGSLVPIKE